MHWDRFKDGFWQLKHAMLISGFNTSHCADFGSLKLIWHRRHFWITKLMENFIHSCGIRVADGKCHANNTPSWVSWTFLENRWRGFLQHWYHELWPIYPIGLFSQNTTTCSRTYFFQELLARTKMEWEFSFSFPRFGLLRTNRSERRSSTSGWTWSRRGARRCTFRVGGRLDAQIQPLEDWAVDRARARWLAGWVSSNGGLVRPGLTPVWPCSDLGPLRSWLSTCSAAWVPERSALGPRTSQSEWRRATACCLWLEKRWEGGIWTTREAFE